jgi:hypothetical protein
MQLTLARLKEGAGYDAGPIVEECESAIQEIRDQICGLYRD